MLFKQQKLISYEREAYAILRLKIRRKEKRFKKPSKENNFKLHLQIYFKFCPKIMMPFFLS